MTRTFACEIVLAALTVRSRHPPRASVPAANSPWPARGKPDPSHPYHHREVSRKDSTAELVKARVEGVATS
eukprot:356953-Rhodomonas_salina.2